MRIIFMGTPDFSVPTLRRLHERGHDIKLVVTQPDRPAGRGRQPRAPAVKVAAVELGLTLEQCDDVNDEAVVARLRAVRPDVIVVVAFGQILHEEILKLPSKGAINVHASLLPRYRGVAPINWVILNGERETGVTTMFMARRVDAGEIILTRTTPIGDRETAGDLSARLSQMGAELLLETLDLVERGDAPRIKQNPDDVTYARKLKKEDGEIDWSRSSSEIANHVRGMTPWPGAYTWYRGKVLCVEQAEPGPASAADGDLAAAEPGEIVGVGDAGIEVAAGSGTILLLEVHPEGRKSMPACDFARGHRPRVGTRPFTRDA
jgi:methionyl-tRNA formyltransferase